MLWKFLGRRASEQMEKDVRTDGPLGRLSSFYSDREDGKCKAEKNERDRKDEKKQSVLRLVPAGITGGLQRAARLTFLWLSECSKLGHGRAVKLNRDDLIFAFYDALNAGSALGYLV
ncbi:hypothetical protein MHYP_G00000800 [Metynnis hypsauchen]